MEWASTFRWVRSRLGLSSLAAAFVALSLLAWWGARAHQRSVTRDLLNSSAPIISPAMELQFASRQPDTPSRREALQPGIDSGYWIIRNPPGAGNVEILLTREGQKRFSTVGSSIVAGFHAGTRLITAVEIIEDAGTTRQVTFTYRWTSTHPATSILGPDTPVLGRDYRGQALLVRSGDVWQLAHWSLPDFELALRKFPGR